MSGIPGQLVILDGIRHSQIQATVIAMCLKRPGLHIEDLCYNNVSMASHIGSNIITLPSASLPLQVYLNQAVSQSLHDGFSEHVS